MESGKPVLADVGTSEPRTIFIDMLGGDACEGTEREGYEGDALPRNLRALQDLIANDYDRILESGVRLVLFGRKKEIEAAIKRAVNRVVVNPTKSLNIEVTDCVEQTPMGSKRAVSGSSMQKMFTQAKVELPDFVYTAGSTTAEGAGALAFREKGVKQRPFIAKQLMPGVEFGDNGALANPTLEDYVMMAQVLSARNGEHNRDPKLMILPSDYFDESEIREKLIEDLQVSSFVNFDPLTELGLFGQERQPSEVLADGFIGNLHLKFVELLYRERMGLFDLLQVSKREAVRNRVRPLEKSTEGEKFEWRVPAGLENEPRLGILCNGSEDAKGTDELKTMMGQLDPDRFFYIEPKDLLSNPNLNVLATPASKALVDAFFDRSFLQAFLGNFRQGLKVRKASKQSTAMAEFVNLKDGSPRIMAAHGAAPVQDTIKNLRHLVDMAIKEERVIA